MKNSKVNCLSLFALMSAASLADGLCATLKANVNEKVEIFESVVAQCVAEGTESEAASDALATALDARNEKVTARLMRAGIDFGDRPHRAVHETAYREMPNLLEIALERDDAAVDLRNGNGHTPLVLTALSGAYLAAGVLIDRGADLNAGEPLLKAVQGRHLHIAHRLIQAGADWRSLGGDLLGAAAQFADMPFLYALIEIGMDPNGVDADGDHVLMYATQHQDESVGQYNWQFLVSQVADPSIPICALTEDEAGKMAKSRWFPKWFEGELDRHRPKCP